MSRRSQSPEGVGDLLKQDSFGGFEEDDLTNDVPDADNPMNGESLYEAGGKEGQTFDEGGDTQMNESNGARPSITRIPVPSFKGVSNETSGGGSGGGGGAAQRTSGGRGPARYFIVKSNNTGNIDHSIKNGIWATQVCYYLNLPILAH